VPKYRSRVEIGVTATSGVSSLGLQEQAVFWTSPVVILARTVNIYYLEISMRKRLDNDIKYSCFLGIKPIWSGALRFSIVICEVLASSRI
jgi:hypothetical protein